jgi:UDP-N-acetylmuramoyl-L-alanyl-D-glutamate--2,6-diaminopimelate ligase
MEQILNTIKRFIPKSLFRTLQTPYHFLLSAVGAIRYQFPSRSITVIGITGTKGKTSTAEFLNAILEADGKKTAVLGTLRFKIGDKNERNLYKMTMPGRFFVQLFLRDAVDAGCSHAIVEMTSEGAKQFRQRFIEMDALIFTNLSPEHIESHGGYEQYRDAKLAIARTLARSNKPRHMMVANNDDKESKQFYLIRNNEWVPFQITDALPYHFSTEKTVFTFRGQPINLYLPGIFSLYNALAAATCAYKLEISVRAIKEGIESVRTIPGRAEEIEGKQPFRIIVDYAHTAESLNSIYDAYGDEYRVCVLGSTGGGRDKWKRPVMGKVADDHCAHIILTNEDPYDEDPKHIIDEIAAGISKHKPEIIIDRRDAIRRAFQVASGHAEEKKVAVIITGKGTDPYIMGPNGTKQVWDDRDVAREEIQKIFP